MPAIQPRHESWAMITVISEMATAIAVLRQQFGDRLQTGEAIRAQHDPEVVDMLVASVFETDTAADDLVTAFGELPGGEGWRMLDVALREGLDAVPDAPLALDRF